MQLKLGAAMSQAKQARIIGTGAYLPKNILTNQDLEKLVETSDEWILTRTGIRERRIASAAESPSTMGAEAAKKALEDASLKSVDVDMILVATMSADFQSSSTASIIQHLIGATRAAAFDLQAACTGFIYALSIAKAYIESGLYRHILVVGSEKMSSFIDYSDRNTCVLFGDGAAAVVVSHQGQGLGISSIYLGSNGAMTDLFSIPAGGSRKPATAESVAAGEHFVKMQGKEVFKHAIRLMTVAGNECLERGDITQSKLKWLVPHQANERIIDALAKAFEIPSSKVYKTVQKYGNTSASSIPIALSELKAAHPFEAGDNILLLAFGAGITYGAALLTQV